MAFVILGGLVAAYVVLRFIIVRLIRALGWGMQPSRPPARVIDPSERVTYKELAGRRRSMALPTLLMSSTGNPGFSKLGGEPDLPPGSDWPFGPAGPMGFVLQVDLAAARAAGGPDWLPAEGALWAFIDDRWGEPDQVRVLHAPPGERCATPPPIALKRPFRYRERHIEFSKHRSVPSLELLGVNVVAVDCTDEEMDRLSEVFYGPLDEPHHRIGGYPEELQGMHLPLAAEHAARGLDYYEMDDPVSPEFEAAAKTWRLLFQIDYDAPLKMKWADAGHVYVMIREADARAGDFSRTVTLSDSH